ncbi:hypothetical protein OAH65_02360 [Gammaproteobacteria bacterium]|nr:hypothetical protein [Gammaproteobacteria bacterium]
MDNNIKILDPNHQTVRSFDISEVSYDNNGIIDFYWPLDNTKSADVMNYLTDALIPYITNNEKKHPELIAVRILFKWFICEVLRLFEATVLSEGCKKDGITPLIPKHYKKLQSLYHSNVLECPFFLNQSSGPTPGRNIPRYVKRLAKEFLWNGLNSGLLRKYGSNKNDILAIGPSSLAIKHAKGSKNLLRYSDFGEWFGSIPQGYILKENKDSIAFQKVLAIVKDSFRESDYELTLESINYISIWLNQANNFVNYYLKKDNELLNNIKGEVWFGCGGSSIWHVMMIEKLRQKDIKVITHDHGSGNSHHPQKPVHWVEFMHTDHFVTFNQINEIKRNEQFKKELIFGKKAPLIQSLDSVLGIKSHKKSPKVIRIKKKIRKIMYVGTAYHGEGARLRPIFHDLTYFDWQIKLLSHLKDLGLEVIYKPHPEGATSVPDGFAESFGFKSTTEKFEDIDDNIDAYIIDFFFSSTTPAVLKKEKPVFFINLGFPELMPDALDLIKKSCYYIKAHYSDDSRLSIDFNQFNQLINNQEHVFDTSFSDIYFSNI